MKKIGIIFIFFMMNSFLFSKSEVIRFLSLGFNSVDMSGHHLTHYFFGFEGYSEAIIFGSSILLSIGDGLFYSDMHIRQRSPPRMHYFFHGSNDNVSLNWNLPGVGQAGLIKRFENDRLVYWASGYRDWWVGTILESIVQDDQRIIIRKRFVNDLSENIFQAIYHNIPANELLALFYRRYVELIRSVIETVNDYSDISNISNEISLLLQGRTARELSIFRNTLFAMRGLTFQTQAWTNFFTQYLVGYNGRYTNDEVIAMFTENEYWLLNMIIQHENRP